MCNVCGTCFLLVQVVMLVSLFWPSSGQVYSWPSDETSDLDVMTTNETGTETPMTEGDIALGSTTDVTPTIASIYTTPVELSTSALQGTGGVTIRNESGHQHVYVSLNNITDRALEEWNEQLRGFGNPVRVLSPTRFSCYGKQIVLGRSYLTGFDSLYRTEDSVGSLCKEDESLSVSIHWGLRYYLKLVPYTRIGEEVMSTVYRVWNSSFVLRYSVGFSRGCQVEVQHLGMLSLGWVQLWASHPGHDDRDFTDCYSEALLPEVSHRLDQAKYRLQSRLQEMLCNILYSPFEEPVWSSPVSFLEKIAAVQQVNLVFSLLMAENAVPEDN